MTTNRTVHDRQKVASPVHVLVVAYGDAEALDRCLAALGSAYPAIVLDNTSASATREVTLRNRATYVDTGENLGFAAAVNRGLRLVPLPDADVLLVNPDATVDTGVVESLRAKLHEAPNIACIAPAQHEPGSFRPSSVCWPFPTPSRAWAEAVGLGRFRRHWGYVIASILLMNGAALVDVGGFDEGFFLYAEEADWERRATRRGWRISYLDDVEALHVGGATDPTRSAVRCVFMRESSATYANGMARWVGARTKWRRF